MKTLYLILGGIINSFLAQMFPYIIKISASCIYVIGYFFGLHNGSDMRGEEDVIIVLLPITILLLTSFLAILIFSNRTIFRKIKIRKSQFVLFSFVSFILFFSLSMMIFDPPNLT